MVWERDALSQLRFIFALEYTILKVQVIQNDLKLNGVYQLMFNAEYLILCAEVNIL